MKHETRNMKNKNGKRRETTMNMNDDKWEMNNENSQTIIIKNAKWNMKHEK